MTSATQNRRLFLRAVAGGMAAIATRGAFAEQLVRTATTGDGPFYPDKLPLDTDNDLLLINDAITPGVGTITHLTGSVLTSSGEPIRNAFVEIWQADNTGSYVHTGARQPSGHDANFQGYGRFLSDSRGRYYFRTIKPVAYTLQGVFRAPHIHVAISKNGRRLMATQALVKGDEANSRDLLIRRLGPEQVETLLLEYKPVPDSKLSELTAHFDVVLGRTAQELEDGTFDGGIGPAEERGNRG